MHKILLFSLLVLILPNFLFAQEIWTLESSVEQILKKAPQILSAGAEVNAKKGELSQAAAWPNPTIEITGSKKLGLNDGSGGNDLTDISLSQPIPLSKIFNQTAYTKAQSEAFEISLIDKQLIYEKEIAQGFHALQLNKAKLESAKEHLIFSKKYQNKDDLQDKEKLSRYLSPLEQKRLHIILANAEQRLAKAEGEYLEALTSFKLLMQLEEKDDCKVDELAPVALPDTLEELIKIQKNHPAIMSFAHQQKASEAKISLTRASRFSDPTVSVFQERDYINDNRERFYGMAVSLEIPFWDHKKGAIAQAIHESEQIKYDLQALKQELKGKLNESYTHLNHLVEQAEHYQKEILVPAQEVFTLTNKGFEVGELDVLTLIDANNVYFESREHYLELLYEAWVELAEVRFSAGLSILNGGKK